MQQLDLFLTVQLYPFDKLDVVKKGVESSWNVSGDNMMIALTMTFMDEPMAKNMSFQREYAEPYDWVAQQFKDSHSLIKDETAWIAELVSLSIARITTNNRI